jgi:hypothetical protein
MSSLKQTKSEKLINPTVRKIKQQLRNKIDEEEDDETMIGLLRVYFISRIINIFKFI